MLAAAFIFSFFLVPVTTKALFAESVVYLTPDPVFELEESTSSDSADSTADIGQKIVDQAFTYKGTRYRFGGHSRSGIDCTGLIIKVWEDLDLGKLKGNCSALYKLGRAVGPEEARPGDLVFFENTYRRGISHVGIYIGNYEFIHASRGRGVNVSKLTSPYYLNRIVGGRRLHE